MNDNTRLQLLIFVALIGLLGAAKPIIYNGGSSMAKYVANRVQLDMVQEEQVEAVFESIVFGEGTSVNDDIETVDTAEGEIIIERIFKFVILNRIGIVKVIAIF